MKSFYSSLLQCQKLDFSLFLFINSLKRRRCVNLILSHFVLWRLTCYLDFNKCSQGDYNLNASSVLSAIVTVWLWQKSFCQKVRLVCRKYLLQWLNCLHVHSLSCIESNISITAGRSCNTISFNKAGSIFEEHFHTLKSALVAIQKVTSIHSL